MKKYFCLFFLFLATFGYSQNYSTKKISKAVNELTQLVTDTLYFDYVNDEEFPEPKLEFWVNDRLTGSILSSDPDYSDNETYSIFQKIFIKGKDSDFLKMSNDKNPGIRIYGFWAFVKNKKYVQAKTIMESEKNRNDSVYWNSLGCEVSPIKTFSLMKDLFERMKNYNN